MVGVDRLAKILLADLRQRSARLHDYEVKLVQEIEMIDSMIAMGYESLADPHQFATVSMLYFAAAIATEESIAADKTDQAAG